MRNDSELIWESYVQEKYGLNTLAKLGGNETVGKVANWAAGTKIGGTLGGKALDTMLSELQSADKQWLAANIDDDAALQQAIGTVTGSDQGQEISAATGVDQTALQKVITNLISQPNIKELVKQKLSPQAAPAAPVQPVVSSAPAQVRDANAIPVGSL
jgi:hypothetical protein